MSQPAPGHPQYRPGRYCWWTCCCDAKEEDSRQLVTMAEMIPGTSKISQRAKTILGMVAGVSSTSNAVMTKNDENKKNEADPILKESINKLYARPYSMTSSVFENFCDTQNTLTSHHFNNLASHLSKLDEAFSTCSKENIFGDFEASSSESQKRIIPAVYLLHDPIDLTCHEEMSPEKSLTQEQLFERSLVGADSSPHNKMPESPLPYTPSAPLDFDSDDSIRDKDYVPSHSSEDSDSGQPASSSKQLLVKNNLPSTTSTEPAPSRSLQPAPLRTAKENILTKKRRITVDVSELRYTKSEKRSLKRLNTFDGTEKSKENNLNFTNINQESILLETTEVDPIPPKRRRYDTSLAQRMNDKKNIKRLEYAVKPACNEKCLKKCSTKFNEQDREHLNKEYWSLTWEQRRLYVQSRMAKAVPKRKYTSEPKRKPKRSFRLHARDETSVEVCKVYFLTTLGYKKNNDKALRIHHFHGNEYDKRGKHQKTPLFNRELLSQHVESFQPTEPPYRREHAPLRRYLPSDINFTQMHKDFCEKHPNENVSYELYRKHVKNMKISFTQLGNEECEACESYNLHKKQTSHDATTQLVAECSDCIEFAKHHVKYTKARQVYTSHKTLPQNENQIFFTTDLEKVIMLPRMDTFKSVIFAQRLVAFNQTFAPVGKITNQSKPVTVIWHDGIAGRKQEDIMSAFYVFLIRNRDVRDVNIWLDNCSAQNKNWLLFSLLVHLVNCDLISTTNISLYSFEPGHTFMSSDQVHHQVELSMKKKGKLYDFTDFKETVASINNGKVIVESLTPENFLNVPNYTSDRRIQKSNPRTYLKNMVQVSFQRNNFGLLYKNDFDDEFTSLQFMNDRYLKNPTVLTITFRSTPKGIESQRKAGIIDKLAAIIPPHKLLFWKKLPTSDLDQQPIANYAKNKKNT